MIYAICGLLMLFVLIAAAYLAMRLPAGTLKFGSVNEDEKTVALSARRLRMTVLIEGRKYPIRFTVSKRWGCMRIVAVVDRNGKLDRTVNINPLSVRRPWQTMSAGVVINYSPSGYNLGQTPLD